MDSETVIPESNDNENSNSEQAGENKQVNSRWGEEVKWLLSGWT